MKVLIINTMDVHGGAAKAANRLHHSLLKNGIDSTMIVQLKESSDPTVKTIYSQEVAKQRWREDQEPVLKYKKSKTFFSTSTIDSIDMVNFINQFKADIIHFHWISGGMLKIEDLPKLNAPIIWNCQDMFPFTGGCHYDENCKKFSTECSKCIVLRSEDADDISNELFKRKLHFYKQIPSMTLIGVSKWITKCLKESPLVKDHKILNIPNGIDSKVFRPLNKEISRDVFGIPKDKKVILFGAMNPLGDPRKGGKELFEALKKITLKDTVFAIAGSYPSEDIKLNLPTYFIPPVKDDISLAFIYNVADVMIIPSLQENLSNSIIENLLCGIPAVSFNIGGNADMITHKETGYLAKPFDACDMAKGIEYLLKHEKYKEISKNARTSALKRFSSKKITSKYIELYKDIIKTYPTTKMFKEIKKDFSHFKTIIDSKHFYNSNTLYNQLLDIKTKKLKCVIYGAGTVCQYINAIIPENILTSVDIQSDFVSSKISKKRIYNPEILSNLEYDKIIISVLEREEKIIPFLTQTLNISEDKIIILKI